MRTLRFIIVIAISIFLFSLSSCKRQPLKPGQTITEVFVESGKITDTTFSSNGYFNAVDKALGIIDSVKNCKYVINGFKLEDQSIYVFENGKIPDNIQKLSEYLKYQCLTKANWMEDYTYKIENDAMVCKKGWVFYTRQKEEPIKRYKANILGNTVYKFEDILFEENYNIFTKYHFKLFSKDSGPDFYNTLNINKVNYITTTGRANLLLNSISGNIELNPTNETPLGDFDKIKFIPTGIGKRYLFRFLYKIHSKDTISKYFKGLSDLNIESNVKYEQERSNWQTYLRKEIYPSYFPNFIEGYKGCNCEDLQPSKARLSIMAGGPTPPYSPPMPLNANGSQ